MGALARIEVGTGPAVLLVHGLNGFKEGWGPLPASIAARGLRAVVVDLPGFGASARLRGRTTPAALTASLAPLIADLAPVAIVGHSLGTQIAMLAAAAHPERVSRTALISPWVFPRPMRLPPKSLSDVLQVPFLGRLIARVAIARIRRSPERRRDAYLTAVADPTSLTSDPEMAGLLDSAAEHLVEADIRAMADWAASALALDVRPMAHAVHQPTLVVWGTLDRITQPLGAEWLARTLPAGLPLDLAGVGHFPHLECPDLVLPAVCDHLAWPSPMAWPSPVA